MGNCARPVMELEEVGEGSRKGGFRNLKPWMWQTLRLIRHMQLSSCAPNGGFLTGQSAT